MQTIGERLEEARKRKGISIREASEATKIRSDYLHKFESNTFELNLPDIYVRGFLRNYAHYLKLNPDKLLTDYSALGLGGSRDSRRDEREVFGRIDLPEPPRTTTGTEGVAREPVAMPDARSRPGQSLPSAIASTAPRANQNQRLKWVLIIGLSLLAVLVLVLLISKSGPSPAPAGSTNPPPVTPPPIVVPTGDFVTLIALDNVTVTVTQVSDGRVLFNGPLIRGERRSVTKDGRVRISYNIGRNLRVEKNGAQFKMSVDGDGRNTVE